MGVLWITSPVQARGSPRIKSQQCSKPRVVLTVVIPKKIEPCFRDATDYVILYHIILYHIILCHIIIYIYILYYILYIINYI